METTLVKVLDTQLWVDEDTPYTFTGSIQDLINYINNFVGWSGDEDFQETVHLVLVDLQQGDVEMASRGLRQLGIEVACV